MIPEVILMYMTGATKNWTSRHVNSTFVFFEIVLSHSSVTSNASGLFVSFVHVPKTATFIIIPYDYMGCRTYN